MSSFFNPPQDLSITVIYAEPGHIWQRAIQVPEGSTVGQALKSVRADLPSEAKTIDTVGIFGMRCELSHVLSDGDRVEIYRPLIFDPFEARRRRAAHRKARSQRGTQQTRKHGERQ